MTHWKTRAMDVPLPRGFRLVAQQFSHFALQGLECREGTRAERRRRPLPRPQGGPQTPVISRVK